MLDGVKNLTARALNHDIDDGKNECARGSSAYTSLEYFSLMFLIWFAGNVLCFKNRSSDITRSHGATIMKDSRSLSTQRFPSPPQIEFSSLWCRARFSSTNFRNRASTQVQDWWPRLPSQDSSKALDWAIAPHRSFDGFAEAEWSQQASSNF